MEPERGRRPRLANAASRLRDGLLRDNKVIPAILGVLALIVFAWIIAGVLIDDPNVGGGGQQVANQSNRSNQPPQRDQAAQSPDRAQGAPEEAQGAPETPAPSVENRDTDSYAAFEQKDPFRDLFQPPDTDDATDPGTDGATDPGADGDQYDDGSTVDGTGDGTGDDTGDDTGDGSTVDGTGDGSGGDDFIDQTFPDDGSGGGSGGGDGADDGLYDSGGELYDSGGNLAP
jgi:hypothetical protein